MPRVTPQLVRKQGLRIALIATAIFIPLFCVYLYVLYRQLNQAFTQESQYIPTRIFSDVSRIASPQPRSYVEWRLKSLGYPTAPGQTSLTFTLHALDYPQYLIPYNHPMLDAHDQSVALVFQGTSPDSPLQSVTLGGHEIPDLYLEPELVAILTRSGAHDAHDSQIRAPIRLDDHFPPLVWKAIIAIEDQHFVDHKGLDPRGLARALWVDLRTRSLAQGGSTLTQQLVKNLMVRRNKNVIRKINELFLSVLLELQFSKEQILERYLNEVNLGQIGNLEIHGVEEGAEHFFGKKLNDLNLGEIAFMAGLIRSPFYYSPYRHWERALERQHLVLKKMVETGQIADAEAQAALKMPIRLAPPQTSMNKAPYFTDFVKAELVRELKDKISEDDLPKAGLRVYTTLDMRLNQDAQQAVTSGLLALEKRLKIKAPDKLEGALACVDHSTGSIRALIGGRNYAESTFNRILNMKRQVGSTFKPIVYLSAFAKGEDPQGVPYSPAYPMEDSPWKLIFDHGRQTWAPRNYEKDYRGWISLRTALAHSVNTVAAKLGYEVGIENVVKTARALGIESPLPAVPSLALGVAELSPVELLRAYSILANHGAQDDLTVIRGITHDNGSGYIRFAYNPKQVFDPAAVDLLTDMLETVFLDGSAKDALDMGFDAPAAGKTGTTSQYRDSWFAGYTPQLTTVVWVGMDEDATPPSATSGKVAGAVSVKESKRPRILLTGATSALPIWVQFMKNALSVDPPETFPLSPYLDNVQFDLHTGKLASGNCSSEQTIMEKVIKTHLPKTSSCEPKWPDSVPETHATF